MKTKAYILIVMLVFATLTSVAATENNLKPYEPQNQPTDVFWWPQYGYDTANTGFTPSAAPITNERFLEKKLETLSSTAGYSSGVVVDGKLFIGYGDGGFYCINAYSGEILWKKNPGVLGASIEGTPLVDGNYVYIGIDSKMYCFNVLTGEQQWVYTTGGMIRGSATAANNRLLFGSTDKKLYCLRLDGSLDWSFTAAEQIFTKPAVLNNFVFFAASKPTYAGFPTGNIYCLSLTTGTQIWRYRTSSPVTPVTVYNNKLYAGAYNTLVCLDTTSGTELWTESFIPGFFSGISAAYDKIYFSTYASSDNRVCCYNASTGTQVWNYSGITSSSAPSIAENKVYINHMGSALNYKTYCLDAQGDGSGSTTVLWEYSYFTATQPPRGQPVIANNRVWVALDRTWIYGFGVNEPPSVPVIEGPSEGEIEISYLFNFTSIDPENQFISYLIDWDDGTPQTWTLWYPGGTYITNHTYTAGGDYQIRAKAKDIFNAESSWSSPHLFKINRPPLRPAAPEGPSTGYVQTEYTFTAVTTDPNEEMISYQFTWGDGTETEWSPYVPSGTPVSATHKWNLPATYQVRVRARDTKNATTDLSPGHAIKIEKQPTPELQIDSIKGGIGVSAVLQNIGNAAATNINYTISLSGGLILLGSETKGTIAELESGEKTVIKSGLILGLGKTTITIRASCNEGMNAEASAQGTVIAIFVVGVQAQ